MIFIIRFSVGYKGIFNMYDFMEYWDKFVKYRMDQLQEKKKYKIQNYLIFNILCFNLKMELVNIQNFFGF